MDNKEDINQVSLPGAGGTEPTILQVLNRNIFNSDSTSETHQQQQIQSQLPENSDQIPTEEICGSSIASETFSTDNDTVGPKSPDTDAPPLSSECKDLHGSDSVDSATILDIESHLIETFENYSVSEQSDSGVVVEEIPPGKEELSKPSTIESESSPKTVIEVQPSVPKFLRVVETEVRPTIQESKIDFYHDLTNKDINTKLIEEEKESQIPHIEDFLPKGGATNKSIPTDKDLGTKEQNVSPVKADISEDSNLNLSLNAEKDPPKELYVHAHEIDNELQLQLKEVNGSKEKLFNEQKSNNIEKTEIVKDQIKEENTNLNEIEVKKIEVQFGSENEDIVEKIKTNVAEIDEKLSENVQNKTDNFERTKVPKEVDLDDTHELIENKNITEENDNENKSSIEIQQNTQESIKEIKLGVNGLPIITSKSEEEAKKIFLDSLPQLNEKDSNSLSVQAKQQFYQSFREYLKKEKDLPPVPLQTYRWEDLRRAKQQGGYPWTHLYKRPLGPDEEPEIILLRKSQELQRSTSESPKSLKKVRIHEQVLVKETEKYISDLSDIDDITEEVEDSRSVQSDSPPLTSSEPELKKIKSSKLRGILKRNRPILEKLDLSPAKQTNSETEVEKSKESPERGKCCHPIMDKLKTMADKQLKRRHIKKIPLKGNEKIVLSEEQKILELKLSPKAERSEIPHFVEKQDSDEILEIVELDESPSKIRKRREELVADHGATSVLVPDEIIEIPPSLRTDNQKTEESSQPTPEPTVSEILEEELKTTPPPSKMPRKKKEHIYEDIESEKLGAEIDEILEAAVMGALKQSLATQDEKTVKDVEIKTKLEEMGSSEEDQDKTTNRLAPISSVDSASSEEERKAPLPILTEETDQENHEDKIKEELTKELKIVEEHEEAEKDLELKSALRREPSPGPDKKVTFSHVEDEAEPHREDIELPEHIRRDESRWSKISDHEYEPIGEPVAEQIQSKPEPKKEPSPVPQSIPTLEIQQPMEIDNRHVPTQASFDQQSSENETKQMSAEEIQRAIEDRYFSSTTTTPRTESRTDYDIHTSQVDSSVLEELPLKREGRRRSFMSTAQDKSRKMQANLRTQAGKLRNKLRKTKKAVSSGSPKTKERKRFKAPEFSKIKMPQIKRPEMPKFKAPEMPKFKAPEFKKIEFKRPDFTKFTKPDMSKFKIPEKFSSLKLKRSKSLKEGASVETTSGTSPESAATPVKKKFDFTFGTYPRAFKRKKDKLGTQVIARADDIASSETSPSFESATVPKVSRDQGPVGSRWIDKFSDVSYGDSESGKYQRYESEPESIERMERESSLEKRMKYVLDQAAEEEAELARLAALQTVEQKQFAEYDEENRAIHEISKSRENEFKKRRPLVHQDSDVVSEESKDVGWTEKDVLKNQILQQNETEELEPENYPSEERLSGSATNTNQETHSTGSSSVQRQKGVIEEIDDDEFFLRKRGISQDNIEIRKYISTAIREGFDTPVNALAHLGDSQTYFPDDMNSNEQVNYGYDVPPPKPRRVKRYNYDQNVNSAEISQEFEVEMKESYEDNISLPQTGSDYFENLPPTRPLRKHKKQHSLDSQEVPVSDIPYIEDEEKVFYHNENINGIDSPEVKMTLDANEDFDQLKTDEPPKAPKRRKKQIHEFVEKDRYVNGFGGRSISNTFLPDDNHIEEFIVYRTEHEYIIPLAQAETLGTPTPPRRSRSRSRATDDDRTSHGADSLALDSHHEDEKLFVEIKENDGYAVVRKEPPPRPPPPIRRKKSPHLMEDQKFATMPHLKTEVVPPERPKRNYSTIGPSRPPRRKSSTSVDDINKNVLSIDGAQYEELDVDDVDRPDSAKNLHSGDIINKMKYRPLPPPPRPPREHKKHKGIIDRPYKDESENITEDIVLNGDYNIDKSVEKCIEVDVWTQTDPLPDDFVCEEVEITEDTKIIIPRVKPKTLEDILKDEQEAEIERAKQLAEEENLTRSIQKFREAGQRSFSERSRGSTAERSKTSLSRPTTPSAIVVERRVPTPIPYKESETMLEASLTVHPLKDLDFEDELDTKTLETKYKDEEIFKLDIPTDIDKQIEEELEWEKEKEIRTKIEMDLEKEKEKEQIKEMEIEEEKEREELERIRLEEEEEEKLLREYLKELRSEIKEAESTQQEEKVEEVDEPKPSEQLPPQPPPRRRSSTTTAEERSAVIPLEPSPNNILTTVAEQRSLETVQEASTQRLAIADLEVERLSVHALQAGRIMVSQLQGASISADELECKSGNLIVRNIELPPGFIQQIVEKVKSIEPEHSQAQTQTLSPDDTSKSFTYRPEEPPVRPPLPQHPTFPSEYMQRSIPPPSFYQLRSPSDEEHHPSSQIHRRRRHHRRRDSTSEEDSYKERRRSRQGTRSPEPTIGQIGGQLIRACGTSVLRTMNQIVNYLQSTQKEGNERNISTAIVLLIFLALGILIIGMSGKNIHHHHWDFFNLPENDGRDQSR